MVRLRSRATFALGALLLLSACGAGDEGVPGLSLGIDLPVGTLGRAPGGEATIVVDVSSDGEIWLDGQGPPSLDGLADALRHLTKPRRWREADGTSRKILLVNADRSLPWVVGLWLMIEAADPRVGIARIFFGARDGSRVGAIARHDGPAAAPAAILPALADVGLRAGVKFLEFDGAIPAPPPEARADVEALVHHVRTLKEQAGNPGLSVEGRARGAQAPGVPAPPARGRLCFLYGSRVERMERLPVAADAPLDPPGDLPFVPNDALEDDVPDESFHAEVTNVHLGTSRLERRAQRRAFPGRRTKDAKEDAVESALAWLAAHQSPNGGWEAAGFPSWCEGKPSPESPDGRGDALSHLQGLGRQGARFHRTGPESGVGVALRRPARGERLLRSGVDGDDAWSTWNAALREAVLSRQRSDGDACSVAGSWDPVDPWGAIGGRVASTALVTLCLEAPYRYRRILEAR